MTSREQSALVVVDVETSGVNPFSSDVLAVAFVPVFGEAPPLEQYVRAPETAWDPYARRLFEGYRRQWEAHAEWPSVVCNRIEHYLASTFAGRRVVPIGHNIGFDVAFLRKLAFLSGRNQLPHLSHRVLDTHTMLYLLHLQGKVPETVLTSDGAFAHFGIKLPDTKRHTAMGDALATRQLFLHLLKLFGVEAEALPEFMKRSAVREFNI